ncbi:MAG TPA: carbohydrate porin [Chthoniobacteraceae bacterium]|nr:carbohydrate porin [Chthoniobacteraceae bacterium]
MKNLKFFAFASAILVAGITSNALAGDPSPVATADSGTAATSSSGTAAAGSRAPTAAHLTLDTWLSGSSAISALPFGPYIHDNYGLSIFGEAKEDFFGQLPGGGLPNQPHTNATTEIKLKALEDFSTFGLQGFTFLSYWRYRAADSSPGYAAGTSGPSSLFNPSKDTTGLGIRMMSQMFEYISPDKKFDINFGWENPYDQFLQQPLSRYFENNNIVSAKGIGGQAGPGIPVINNDVASSGGAPGIGSPTKGGARFYTTSSVPWSSSYQAWGATLKIKPEKDFYIQTGLYESISTETGVTPSQFLATNVYPYTSVPSSYLGLIKYSNELAPVVGGNGQIIPGALQNLGWVPAATNNHGFDFGGAPGFNPGVFVAVKPTSASGGTLFGTKGGVSTYKNSAGQFVNSPALYANSPFDQGGIDGNYSHNGLYNVNEIGWTPKFGPDKLEGKYAFGDYLWGQPNSNYTPTEYTLSVFNPKTNKIAYTSYGATKSNPFEQNPFVWGIYLQADQQLFSLGGPKDPAGPFTTRGLYTFNEFTFTPPQNNAMPLYFQTGLVFNGPLESRPADAVGIAVAAGFYSPYFNHYTQSQNAQLENAFGSAYNATLPNGPTQQGAVNPGTGVVNSGKTAALPLTNYYSYLPNYTSTEVIEAFYKVQLNKWAYFKPDVQYIINPAGNRTLGNDWVLGFSFDLTF